MFDRRILTVLIILVSSAAFFCPQNTYCQDGPPIKIDTALLRIPVFVSDRNGKPVIGLTKDDFVISANGQKRTIDFFVDKGPVSFAIVIDSNSNMSDVLERVKRDAQRFVDLLGTGERAMVVSFDIGYKVECELTSDRTKLRRSIGKINANRDRIRIMSGVVHQVVFRELAGIEGRKAIVLFADPDSNIPPYGKPHPDLVSNDFVRFHYGNLSRSDVTVYPIFYQTSTFPTELVGKSLSLSQLAQIHGVDYFNLFAVMTGGRLHAAGASNFEGAFEQILLEIRNQYILSSYLDNESEKGSFISVKSNNPDHKIRSKERVEAGSSESVKLSVARLSSLRKQ